MIRLVPAAAPDGAIILDTDTKLTLARLRAIDEALAEPVWGIVRYVSVSKIDLGADIDPVEAEIITTFQGKHIITPALGLVQHALEPGWTASPILGTAMGALAAEHASLVGYTGDLFFDDEGAGSVGPPVAAVLDAWGLAVVQVASAGLYIGYDPGLDPDELWARPSFHVYWGAAGPWTVDNCGVAMRQELPKLVGGTMCDRNVAQADKMGRRVVLASAA